MTDDERHLLETLQAECAALVERGALAEGVACIDRMLALLRASDDPNPMDVAGCYRNRGYLQEHLRQWDDAEASFRRCVEIVEAASGPETLDVVPALDALAGFLSRRERAAAAETIYRRMLRILTEAGETATARTAACLNELAIAVRGQGRPREAEPLYKRVIDIIVEAVGPDDLNLASVCGNLALLYVELRRLPEAVEQLDRVRRIFDAKLPPNDPEHALLLKHRAMVATASGDLAGAEMLDREALRLREAAYGPDHVLTAESLHALGVDRLALGWLDDAASTLGRALQLRESLLGLDHLSTLLTCNALAAVQEQRRELGEAAALYRRVLAGRERQLTVNHPATLTSLNNLAALLERTERYDEAAELYERALATAANILPPDDPRLASLLNNYAILQIARGNLADAEKAYERALAIEEQTNDGGDVARASTLTNLALVRWRDGRFTDAAAPLRRAVETQEHITALLMATGSERQKRTALATTVAQLHAVLTFHLHAQPGPGDARELAAEALLQRKGRLLDSLASTLERARQAADGDEARRLERWVTVRIERARLSLAGVPPEGDAGYSRRLTELLQEEEQLEGELGDGIRQHLPQQARVAIADVCQALPADAALIEFVRYEVFDPKAVRGQLPWGDERYAAFLFDRDGLRFSTDLGLAAGIEQTIDLLRSAVADPDSDYRQPACDLYRVLLEPLDNAVEMSRYGQLLIAPDGALNLVPFSALIAADQRHLTEHAAISYLGSGRDLLRTRASDASANANVSVAAPLLVAAPEARQVGDGDTRVEFEALDGVRREIALLEALMPDARVLTGDHASAAELRQWPRPRLLHIAGHAAFEERQEEAPAEAAAAAEASGTSETDGEAPPRGEWSSAPSLLRPSADHLLESWFVLGDDAGGHASSRVSALELTTLDLRGTELVTLSACETGVGPIRPGDGVYDLRRAFQLAGAHSLIVSLWSADDDATCELIDGMYRRLEANERRVDALRLTQHELLRDPQYAHPYFWASFVLIGDYERMKPGGHTL